MIKHENGRPVSLGQSFEQFSSDSLNTKKQFDYVFSTFLRFFFSKLELQKQCLRVK